MTRTILSSRVLLRIAAVACAVLATSAVARAQTVDPAFDPGADNAVRQVLVQPDGKILVSGNFTWLGGGGTGTLERLFIGRINPDGTPDGNFRVDLIGGNIIPWALQPDGRIVVGQRVAGHNFMARLETDGRVDASFDPGADNTVVAVAVQPDGRILAGGHFSVLGASLRSGIGRLHADGSLDTSFDPGLAAGSDEFRYVRVFARQPDGKILVAGHFGGIGGGTGSTPRQNIARLNADGTVDASFNPGTNGDVLGLAVQADGKILVGGWFTLIGGGGTGTTARDGFARLNADGSLDTGFKPSVSGGIDASVYTFVLQADGKILVGGSFSSLAGTTRHNLARLNEDGSVDPGFDPGANAPVNTIGIQDNGLIVVGGSFTTLGGGGTGSIARNRLGRLLVGPMAPFVTAHPSNQTVFAPAIASFSAQAAGNPQPAVQWQVSTDGGAAWTDVTGATSTTYAFVTTAADDEKMFRAVFSNSLGDAMTNTATLVVNVPVPPSVTAHPANQTTKVGRTASFTATAVGTPAPTVQWQASANSGGTWNDIAGASSTTYTFTATPAAHGMWFRAVFTNLGGQLASDPATLTVRSVSGSDFDGNATTDIALYRRTNGFWYIGNDQWVQYGGPGYVPVAGDYNGDGTTDIAVYQPSTGFWYVRDQFWTQFGHPGDMPVPGDYDGNGTTDLAVYRPSTGGWYVRNQLGIVGFGGPDYIPVVADYDGNGTTDIAVYRPSTAFWYVRGRFAIQFGVPGAVPVPSDYNGDGAADLAVYQPSTGQWSVRNQFTVQFGSPGDVPVGRDFNGDGTADVAVYRPSTGHWFVRNQFTVQFGDAMDVPVPRGPLALAALNGDYDADRVTNLAVYTASTGLWRVRNGLEVAFGQATDKPVPADYNGDGSMDLAVYRPSTGTWDVRDQFTVDLGVATDIPVPGDYNGDGLAEVAVYRPSTGFWFILNQPAVHFGDTGDIPVPADYNGDGSIDIAVYRPSTGYWYVRNQMAVQFGAAGTVPVPGDYNGDGMTDFAVFDTATGTWDVRGQFSGVFGDGTDTPVPGDYDGDGTTDVAVYRPSTGTWDVLNQFTIVFGDPGDVPVVRIGGNH